MAVGQERLGEGGPHELSKSTCKLYRCTWIGGEYKTLDCWVAVRAVDGIYGDSSGIGCALGG